MKDEILYGTGCTPSVIDGTEIVLDVDNKIPLPKTLSWREVMPPVRNQGATQTCVCQTLTGMLDFQKNAETGEPGKCNGFSIDELYAQRTDKRLQGMSFKDAFHYLRHHGLDGEKINGYAKVNSIDAAKFALVMFGPISCGLPVFNTGKYFWRKGNQNKGGHAVMIVGFTEEGFIIRNSWGDAWGDHGYTEIPYQEFKDNCFECWTFLS